MNLSNNQIEKSKLVSNIEDESKNSDLSNIGSFIFDLVSYYPVFTQAIFLKLTGLGKCKQKYCNHGDYCELSRKFLSHKWFVEYFCKIEGYGPDEKRIRDGGIFHTYLGCSPKKK